MKTAWFIGLMIGLVIGGSTGVVVAAVVFAKRLPRWPG